MRYTLLKVADGSFRFLLKSSNGLNLMVSRLYGDKREALLGIEAVRVHGTQSGCFEKHRTLDGLPFFVLRTDVGQALARSKAYASKTSCDEGIEAVRRGCALAKFRDLW